VNAAFPKTRTLTCSSVVRCHCASGLLPCREVLGHALRPLSTGAVSAENLRLVDEKRRVRRFMFRAIEMLD
jgi:hypothetical protein